MQHNTALNTKKKNQHVQTYTKQWHFANFFALKKLQQQQQQHLDKKKEKS